MTEAEWDLILDGLRVLTKAMRQAFRAQDEAWRAEVDQLPKKLRDQVYAAARAQNIFSKPVRQLPLWNWLWTKIEGHDIVSSTAREVMKRNKALIAEIGRR